MGEPPAPERQPDRQSCGMDEFVRLLPGLYAWARLRTPSSLRRRVEPADLAHDVWVRVAQCQGQFDPRRGSFRAFVFGVAKMVLHELMRRQLRLDREGVGGSTSRMHALAEKSAAITSVTQRAAKSEEIQQFLARVRELEEVDRMLVVHCGLEEMSVHDAATRLTITYEAAAKRWQRLRGRMRGWRVPVGVLEAG